MVDISHKQHTHRQATAQAIITCSQQATIDAIKNNTVPKGNVLEIARAAALLAIKNTPQAIPDCHPLPIEFAQINYTLENNTIIINVQAATVYKTGVEVEAIHGAMIAALTIYDMLKPIDKSIIIGDIKLLEKTGGKSDKRKNENQWSTKIIVCSDSISQGTKGDVAGKKIIELISPYNFSKIEYCIIPDEKNEIENQVTEHAGHIDLIIFCGGTGVSQRDVTTDAVIPLLDYTIPGIMEAARNYGQQRTPYAMLSRGIAGVKNNSLILCLPGSTRGAQESIQALFPAVLHTLEIINYNNH